MQVEPREQQLGPVQDTPPHWPYQNAQEDPVEMGDVELEVKVEVEVEVELEVDVEVEVELEVEVEVEIAVVEVVVPGTEPGIHCEYH